MNYKDLDIKRSYISRGNNNIAEAFLIPALKFTKIYKRSVGFFSSGVLELILDGIVSLVRNNGIIQLIASPKLNEDDINAINLGYKMRKDMIYDYFTRDFLMEVEKLNDNKLQMLCELISRGVLDIKIAITNDEGMYHDKLGILKDFDNNNIVFYGSSNSSYGGYRSNYEKIRVVKGWDEGNKEIIIEEELEFDTLWEGKNEFVEVYQYSETAKLNLLEVIKKRKNSQKDKKTIKLRDYQEQAIKAWVDNDYHGFYVMATGTGKTWTAIYSTVELMKNHSPIVVICAPYKHLIKQWAEDVEKTFINGKIIMVSSENQGWEKQIMNEIIRKKYNSDMQLIIISTIASFNMDKFINLINKSDDDKLLIVDEAHRFTNRSEKLHEIFDYMLGLSATPYSGSSAEKGRELMKFFGGQVFNLPIETALQKGFLVPYYYKPIFVNSTDYEEKQFNEQSMKIGSCFKNNICINPDLLVKSLRNRLRIISMSEEKQSRIDEIINEINDSDHFVVYCGDGRLFDNKSGEEIRHIQSIKRVLTDHGFKTSQFTAKENMDERMQLVDSFNKGEISSLVAIRCLDEGINIPSIKSALILSSNDDYREFVQRRGRILRTYEGKENATIYDVIVLPSSDMCQWAKIELRRFLEYGRLALNWNDLEIRLNDIIKEYSIKIEDIDVYDYEDIWGDEDE